MEMCPSTDVTALLRLNETASNNSSRSNGDHVTFIWFSLGISCDLFRCLPSPVAMERYTQHDRWMTSYVSTCAHVPIYIYMYKVDQPVVHILTFLFRTRRGVGG